MMWNAYLAHHTGAQYSKYCLVLKDLVAFAQDAEQGQRLSDTAVI